MLFLELDADPYDPDEEDPAQSRALESSLWELQVRPVPGSRPALASCPPAPTPMGLFLLPRPPPSLSPWLPGGTLTSVWSRHSVPSVGRWEASQPRGDGPRALQALQRHYHPEVSKAASVINQALSVPEASIAPLLELTAFEVRARLGEVGRAGSSRVRASVCLSSQIFERDLKKKWPEAVPLEFIPAQGLLGRRDDLCAQHFTLS